MLSILDCGENSYIFICQSSKMNALFFFTKPFPKSTSYKLFRTQNSVCSMQLDFLQRTSQKYFNFIYREHNLLFQDKIIVKTSEKFNCDISKIYEKLNSKSKFFTYLSGFHKLNFLMAKFASLARFNKIIGKIDLYILLKTSTKLVTLDRTMPL